MIAESQELHLVLDPLFRGNEQDANKSVAHVPPFDTLKLPVGTSYLSHSQSQKPQVLPYEQDAPEDALVLEPVKFGKQLRLVVIRRSCRTQVAVNGTPAFPVSVLQVGDQLQLANALVLHVTIFRRPTIGPALDEQRSKKCAYCSISLESSPVVFTCPECGNCLHLESEENKRGDVPLQCAQLCSLCSVCQAEIHLIEGFAYVPE